MSRRILNRLRAWLRIRRVYVTLELIGLAVLLGALGWALRDVWADAAPLLRHADLTDFALGTAIVAAYYLVFVLGWMRILAAYGIRIPYRVALQSEMLSMLAKYVPGRRLDADGARRRAAAVRRPRHAGRARVDPARGRALGGRRRRRLPRRARDHRRRRRAAAAARRLWRPRRVPALPAGVRRVASRLLRPFGARQRSRRCRRARRSSCSASTRSPGRSAAPASSSCCGRWAATRRSRRSRSSAASAPSARSSPCSRSSPRRGSASARRRCTGCCSRSSPKRSRSARSILNRLAITLVEACSCSSAALLLRGSAETDCSPGARSRLAPVAALPRDEVLRG